ncbi:hypothetical protein ACQE98_03180 [Ornithinimicrobium sp. W1679]|uniref:hypothetical protein n=1 Tax=Ornithinimicrobium sp. W1679 TaxID=3418770 RepID=UPI003CF3DFBB
MSQQDVFLAQSLSHERDRDVLLAIDQRLVEHRRGAASQEAGIPALLEQRWHEAVAHLHLTGSTAR